MSRIAKPLDVYAKAECAQSLCRRYAAWELNANGSSCCTRCLRAMELEIEETRSRMARAREARA